MEKDLVGTVSVLHAEIEKPLNLLCDCMNKPPSQSVSLRCSFAVYCVAFGRFLTLLWQSCLAAAASAPGPESKAAVPCLSPAPAFCSIPPPTPSPEEMHIDLSAYLQPNRVLRGVSEAEPSAGCLLRPLWHSSQAEEGAAEF